MRMHRNICVLFLILMIAAVLLFFASCGSTNDNIQDGSSDKNEADTSPDDKQTPDESEKPEFIPATEKYDGYEFKMFNYISFGASASWVALDYSDIAPETINADPINDAIFNRNTVVEDLYDINIKEVNFGERFGADGIDRLIRVMMTGDSEFDAALSTGGSMPRLIGLKNAMYDLNSIPELDLNKSWWDQNCIKEFTLGGKLYAVTGDITIWNSLSSMVFFFNKKLISDCGLESPYNLVQSGEWTWDKMEEMAKEASVDNSGDGKIDRNDQIGIACEGGTPGYAIFCIGERVTYKDENDLPVVNINLERVSNLMDKVLPILKNSNISYATSDLHGRYRSPYFDFTMPKFRDDGVLFYTQQLLVALNLREMEADFGILPFPKLDAQQTEYRAVAADHFLKYAWIPTTNGEPEKAANILQAMAYYNQQTVTPAVYDVTITNKALRDEESREMLKIIMNNRVYDFATIYQWGNILSMYGSMFDKGANNLASEFEKNLPAIEIAIQTSIDEIFG